MIKRQRDYNFKHFRYRNFGIVPEWFIIKFQARNDYWAHPWSFKKSVLLVSSHPKASHPQIWKIFWKWKTLFSSSYCWMITVIFHVAYTYISSKFLVKRPSSFIIKKCLLWRLRDFSSIANLAGIPVAEPKSDLKIQKFISNDEEWGVKLHFCYKKIPLKNRVTFLEKFAHKNPMFSRYSLRYESVKKGSRISFLKQNVTLRPLVQVTFCLEWKQSKRGIPSSSKWPRPAEITS